MIAVIQCAGSKQPHAGFMQLSNGKKVSFVADPGKAPPDTGYHYAHPDDICADTGRTWRDELLSYNAAPGDNPLRLLPAWELYKNPVYKKLADHFTPEKLYILSAGWGLIRSDFLTPRYDITFSNGQKYVQRLESQKYDDLNMLPQSTEEPIFFFLGPKYIPLARDLTAAVKARRYLFHKRAEAPQALGFILNRYTTSTRTNWHYECAKAFMNGQIDAK